MLFLKVFLTLLLTSIVSAERYIKSEALLSCMKNSQFTASSFDVRLYPDKGEVNFDIAAISTIEGKITVKADIIAYGITVISEDLDPCTTSLKNTLCPIQAGHFDITNSTQKLPKDIISQIPGIAFDIPDLDGRVKVQVFNRDDKEKKKPIACVEATLTNGKTVQTKYASWAIAAICALGLITAGLISVAGHTSTAAHIASNTISLFLYFQSVAIVSMQAVDRCPPIAAAWAENFMWTMGLMRLAFMQTIFNWYVQATGGSVTNLLPNANVISLSVQKRDVSGIVPDFPYYENKIVRRAVSRSIYRAWAAGLDMGKTLMKRASEETTTDENDDDLSSKTLVLRGMQRVAYLTNIEISSLFLTGVTFFLVFGVVLMLCLAVCKGILELLVKTNTIHSGRFSDYRRGYRTVMKGVLFRLVLIAFPQLSVLCLWELVQQDSPATIALAVLVYVIIAGILGFASYKVISIARRSLALHKNPAYILFSDPSALDRWGFLYIQYRATAYYFVLPMLVYTFCKSCFIALAQASGKAQAMGVFIIELAWLVAVSWLKPYMDKKTNALNIACAAINFVNALFFLFFSNLFGQPDYVSGVMGVVFFILNAVFSLVLLIMIIVSCVWAYLSKNPDNRYQPMRDDRESFIRDANMTEKKMTTELDALGASARDGYHPSGAENSQQHLYRGGVDDEFANSRNSLDGSFPQARLPRRNSPDDDNHHLNVYSNPLQNNSTSDLESPQRTESPGFPSHTGYSGYMPTPTDAYAPPQRREPPRF